MSQQNEQARKLKSENIAKIIEDLAGDAGVDKDLVSVEPAWFDDAFSMDGVRKHVQLQIDDFTAITKARNASLRVIRSRCELAACSINGEIDAAVFVLKFDAGESLQSVIGKIEAYREHLAGKEADKRELEYPFEEAVK